MTVSNTTFKDEYTGDGSTTAFAFTWRLTDEDQIAVYSNNVLKTLGTHYTIESDLDTDGVGGTVTYLVAPASGVAVRIERVVDTLQEDDLQNNRVLPPATVMRMIDKLTMLCQQALNQGTRYAQVTLTAAQVQAIRATPIKLVSAPGAGKILVPVATTAYLNHAGTDFAAPSAATLGLLWDNGSTVAGPEILSETDIEETTGRFFMDTCAAQDMVTTALTNAALYIKNTGGSEITGGTSATLTIGLVYVILG